jgi:hypothetical protein
MHIQIYFIQSIYFFIATDEKNNSVTGLKDWNSDGRTDGRY